MLFLPATINIVLLDYNIVPRTRKKKISILLFKLFYFEERLVNFNIYSSGITQDIIFAGVGCVVTCREELRDSSYLCPEVSWLAQPELKGGEDFPIIIFTMQAM